MKITSFNKTLENWIEVTLPQIRSVSEKTIRSYSDSFIILFDYFREERNKEHYKIDFKDFDAFTIESYINYLRNKRKNSDNSIRQRMSVLSSFLKYASGREPKAIKAYNAVQNTLLPRQRKGEFPYFTKEEIKILLNLPKNDGYSGCRNKTILVLLYDAGLRAQEISDLKVKDLYLDNETRIRICGKGNKTREIAISPQIIPLLERYVKENKLNDKNRKEEFLFKGQRNNRITPACIRNLTNKYVEIAKKQYPELFPFKKYSPHSFRHSRAMHLLQGGVPLIYIKDFLGHSSVTTTEIYAQVSSGSLSKALLEKNSDVLDKGKNEEKANLIPDFLKKCNNE